jgi:plastocyanin
MIWRWATFFSLAGALAAATVEGRVELRDSREAAVNRKMDYSSVVVWIERPGVTSTASAKHAQMLQKNKTFTPHLLAITAGTSVDFPNLDPIFHNAFSNYDGQIFDVSLYPPGTTRSVRFMREGVVRVFCNIHAAMSAVIIVLKTPYFDTTGRDGHFEIADAPAGDYTLHVFHERATQASLDALTRTVHVTGADVVVPTFSISESGYLHTPHTNKYGRAYVPPPDEGALYPAAKK